MIWLYTAAVFLIFLILILFAPINLIIEYKKQLKIAVKFMGIPFSINFKNKKKNKQETNIVTPKKKENKKGKKKNRSQKNVLKLMGNFGKLLKIAKESIVSVAKKIKINRLRLILYIGSEDAADTAIKYGQANAIVYPTLSIINTLSKPKRILVNIIPNFPSEKIETDFKIDIKSSIFNLATLAIKLFKKYKEIF